MLKRINKSNGNSNPENGHKSPTRSRSTTAQSGQSMSTSGSVGSPSSRSEAAMTTPSRESTFARLNDLDIQGEDAGPQGAASFLIYTAIRERGVNVRQFSMKVCEKVESKGRATYNEVADELVAEFQDSSTSAAAPDHTLYDEKNIRRRVYDALNVLMAMDIISKDKKEIQWKGLSQASLDDIEVLNAEQLGIRNRIEKKAPYLKELEEHYIGLQNLIQRNELLYCSGNVQTGGVALPFILVQTRPHATVEVEISEDMQLVHFDFNSTPFELHDDSYVLKAMNFCEKSSTQNMPMNGGESSSSMPHASLPPQPSLPSRINNPGRPPASPLPGILKSRFVTHEH